MHKKPLRNAIVLVSIALLLVISVSPSLSPNIISYAFLGFDLGGGDSTDQSLGNSQRSIQGAHCYSPNASIVDSCNSGDGSDSENFGHNFYGQ